MTKSTINGTKPGLPRKKLFALALFAFLLTRSDVSYAGRAYAAYGGVYIVGSLAWLWAVEGTRPDRWDLLGSAICLVGAALIFFGPRNAV